MDVTIWDSQLATDEINNVKSVFFVNQETHSDEKRLSQRDGSSNILYVNSSLALAVLVRE